MEKSGVCHFGKTSIIPSVNLLPSYTTTFALGTVGIELNYSGRECVCVCAIFVPCELLLDFEVVI